MGSEWQASQVENVDCFVLNGGISPELYSMNLDGPGWSGKLVFRVVQTVSMHNSFNYDRDIVDGLVNLIHSPFLPYFLFLKMWLG